MTPKASAGTSSRDAPQQNSNLKFRRQLRHCGHCKPCCALARALGVMFWVSSSAPSQLQKVFWAGPFGLNLPGYKALEDTCVQCSASVMILTVGTVSSYNASSDYRVGQKHRYILFVLRPESFVHSCIVVSRLWLW